MGLEARISNSTVKKAIEDHFLEVITITYTNWRGETADRRIVAREFWFGNTNYHSEDQWLLEAFDLDRWAVRTFSLKDIKAVQFNKISGSYLKAIRCKVIAES